MQGVIFDIKRFAIHDGPGIRTSVFFKGCPLNCWWCHNPESRAKGIQTISKGENGESEKIGIKVEKQKLLEEIRKDQVFYDHSGGGVTFTGGEPTLQLEFLRSLLISCKKEDFHTAVDTSGYLAWDKLAEIVPYTDLFLYDLKHMDSAIHKSEIGVSNEMILKNLEQLDSHGANIRIRIPMVPDFNSDVNHLKQLKEFLTPFKNISGIHILPYHKLGRSKYERFALKSMKEAGRELLNDEIEIAKEILSATGHQITIGG